MNSECMKNKKEREANKSRSIAASGARVDERDISETTLEKSKAYDE
jgi:hypothetical protein